MGHRLHRINSRNIDNSGFGPNSSIEGNRLTNKDGSYNIRKNGMPFWERISVFHSLLRMKSRHFAYIILMIYTGVNLFFASVYYFIGVKHLVGTNGVQSEWRQFLDAFFFSSQTLTTVGYGHIAPSGILTNLAASIESLVGILLFALLTGLIYGRFSRPMAFILFSSKVLISPYKQGRAVMMRIATYKNNHLTDVEASVTMALHVEEQGNRVTKFFPLKLEFSKINSLALSWTIVHPIDEDSPLWGFFENDIIDSKMELILTIKAFDDHFSNIVQQRTSYTYNEMIYGAKFLPMFTRASAGNTTVLELNKIDHNQPAELPEDREIMAANV
jgi:inward rectifier potassium channel